MKVRDRIKELRRVPAGQLLPNAKNWRTHPDAQKNALRGILAEVGIAGALLARETPHGLMLIDGHLRADTDPTIEWPVLVLDVTEEEADKLLATVDPIAEMAEVDEEALAALLAEIDIKSAELREMLEEKAGIADEPVEGLCDPDEVPEAPPVPVTQAGDVWVLGGERGHRLMCGDSADAKSLDLLMAGEKAGIVLTDPPYSSGSLHAGGRRQSTNTKYKQTESKRDYLDFSGDNRDQRSFVTWCSLWMSLLSKFCQPQAYLIVFCDWRQVPSVTDAVQVAGWTWRGINVWDKGDGARMAHMGYFRSQAEFAVWCTPGALDAKYEAGGETHTGVLRCSIDSDKVHLTQKPVDVMTWLMKISTGSVLEPFSGSGTTIIAATQLSRRCFACEISPQYCDVALARWAKFTGGDPVRESDGARFSELVARRDGGGDTPAAPVHAEPGGKARKRKRSLGEAGGTT